MLKLRAKIQLHNQELIRYQICDDKLTREYMLRSSTRQDRWLRRGGRDIYPETGARIGGSSFAPTPPKTRPAVAFINPLGAVDEINSTSRSMEDVP